MDNTVSMWNAIRKLFKAKKKRVVRACRSKLILNADENEFCELVGGSIFLASPIGAAVRRAAVLMGISRHVAWTWYRKPKCQQAIAKVQQELVAQEMRNERAEASTDPAEVEERVPEAGVRILPAEEK